jgi:hypothetical protein
MEQKIIIGADHAGFQLKETVKSFLKEKDWVVSDIGTDSEEAVDYPDFGEKVAGAVSAGVFSRASLYAAQEWVWPSSPTSSTESAQPSAWTQRRRV